MRDKLIIAGLLLAIGGVAGWNMRSPTPPPVETLIEYREIAAKAETVYVRDTVRYHEWKVVYDTTRQYLNVTDTVEVLRYVKVADSTIKSCSLALASCGVALRAKDSVVRYQMSYIAKSERRQPAILRWTSNALMLYGGVRLAQDALK